MIQTSERFRDHVARALTDGDLGEIAAHAGRIAEEARAILARVGEMRAP